MFSGLVEACSEALKIESYSQLLRISLKRPSRFLSLKKGESIAVDGVCLTLEKFNAKSMTFALAPETLKITKWNKTKLKNKILNLEQSLTLEKALGGHLLTGHVDGLAFVTSLQKKGESKILKVRVAKSFSSYFFKKGYIALNGVSLTVNKKELNIIEVCLVPETLKLSNLDLVKKGDYLNFEVDYWTRIVQSQIAQIVQTQKLSK